MCRLVPQPLPDEYLLAAEGDAVGADALRRDSALDELMGWDAAEDLPAMFDTPGEDCMACKVPEIYNTCSIHAEYI